MPDRQPTSPREARQLHLLLKILYLALLAATGFYWLVLEMLAANLEPRNDSMMKTVLGALAAATAGVVLYLRFSRIPPLLDHPTTDLSERLSRLRGFYILCFALAEAVGLYGFAVGLVSGKPGDAVPFFAGAAVLFLLCYPRLPESLSGSGSSQ